MIRRPPRSTLSSSSAASDVYKRQGEVPFGPFPASPSRTRRAGFPAPGSPVIQDIKYRFGALHYAYLPVLRYPVTYAPLPCGRLSRPPWWVVTPTTTTGTPSP